MLRAGAHRDAVPPVSIQGGGVGVGGVAMGSVTVTGHGREFCLSVTARPRDVRVLVNRQMELFYVVRQAFVLHPTYYTTTTFTQSPLRFEQSFALL